MNDIALQLRRGGWRATGMGRRRGEMKKDCLMESVVGRNYEKQGAETQTDADAKIYTRQVSKRHESLKGRLGSRRSEDADRTNIIPDSDPIGSLNALLCSFR
ncbi:hypothetical protein JTE90_011056 [Oedothorax gibbosus]|uniref:Uncharacterized protein n=1 Tax=Oedothorax gibbosus TaxID=931172 RepID=A0AAV6VFQ2_9ARAC|nr:hypothetical protein JTE90_011056 [Oedothorax gibbosus]